jgi:hypothetical protein
MCELISKRAGAGCVQGWLVVYAQAGVYVCISEGVGSFCMPSSVIS